MIGSLATALRPTSVARSGRTPTRQQDSRRVGVFFPAFSRPGDDPYGKCGRFRQGWRSHPQGVVLTGSGARLHSLASGREGALCRGRSRPSGGSGPSKPPGGGAWGCSKAAPRAAHGRRRRRLEASSGAHRTRRAGAERPGRRLRVPSPHEQQPQAAQHEAGAARPPGCGDRSADGCADCVPCDVPPLGRRRRGLVMMRRCSRAQDAQRLKRRAGAYRFVFPGCTPYSSCIVLICTV
jgi:hypothetical protein